MSKNKKIVYLICFFIIGILTIYVLDNPFTDGRCDLLDKFRKARINGAVSEKYIDSSQHSYPTVIIRGYDSTTSLINLVFDTTNTFKIINIGDVVIKDSNSQYLIIQHKGIQTTKYLDFGCK